MSARVVVVGGGISGLAVAHALMHAKATPEAAAGLDVLVLERAARLGGNIRTVHEEGFTIDTGPDSWVVAKPHASALARAAGLEAELVPTRPTSRRVYVAVGGRLLPAPEGMVLGIPTEVGPFLRSPLFSPLAKLRMALEPLVKRRTLGTDDDESIGDFLARRLGADASSLLAVPMLGGIFAGDANRLSIRMAFPQLVAAEAKYGSLVRAMRATRKPSRGAEKPSAFVSLRGGMADFVERLAASVRAGVPGRIRTSTEVTAIEANRPTDSAAARDGAHRFRVSLASGESVTASHVVLTGPTHVSAALLASLDAPLAEALGAIRYASTAIVFFAFDRAAIDHPLDASGFLVPRPREGHGGEILASTWVSSKWEGRVSDGRVLLRVFVGGAGREAVLERDDRSLTALALAELRTLMPVRGMPNFERVYRYERASPQPEVFHLGRVKRVHAQLARWPGLHVTTNGFEGIGIPDCVKCAEVVAARVMADVAD